MIWNKQWKKYANKLNKKVFQDTKHSDCQNLYQKNSNILSLNPILVNKLTLIGGRLKHADVPFNAKHQVILDKRHYICKRLKTCMEVIRMLAGYNVYQFSETNLGYQTVMAWLKTFYQTVFFVKNKINHLKCHVCQIFLKKD